MIKHQANRINRIILTRMIVVLLFLGLGSAGFLYSHLVSKTHGSNGEEKQVSETAVSSQTAGKGRRYSKFSHSRKQHKRACNTCHKFPSSNWKQVRKGDDAFPDITDYPKHTSCLNCHRRQFFSGPKPVICSICHTNPSPRRSTRHAFPNPRERFDLTAKGKRSVSQFNVNFPHEMHVAMMGENRDPFRERRNLGKTGAFIVKAGMRSGLQSDTCATCHQTYQPQGDGDEEYVTKPPAKLGDAFWLKKGTFKASPLSHTQCFTCHSADSGMKPAPSDCGTCHQLKQKGIKTDFDAKTARTMRVKDKIMLTSWRKRNSSATFRHEWFSHKDIDCTACHKTADINTIDAKIKKVSVTSCNNCHITATSDDGGILNFEIDSRKKDPKFQCVKCHLAYGSSAIPESHTKAISDLGGK